MQNYKLVGHHVRIVWREFTPRVSNQISNTIFRGQVAHQDEHGLWLWGRYFIEKVDTKSVRELPREKDGEMRMYFGPWISLDSIQVIPEDSKDYKIHQLVMTRKNDIPNGQNP